MPETSFTNPDVPVSTYRDLFGNRCRRLVAPADDLTMWGDATIEDDARPDRVAPNARELPVSDLPDDSLVYLMGSRYRETDKLSQLAWDIFGTVARMGPRADDLRLCPQPHPLRLHEGPLDAHGLRGLPRARRRLSRFRAPCRRLLPLPQYPHSLRQRPSRRHRRADRRSDGFSAWIEVLLDGEWHTFNPRNNTPRIGRIVVARGRGAADIPLINSFGPHVLKAFRVWTYEVPALIA